jgi:hypothetical protein
VDHYPDRLQHWECDQTHDRGRGDKEWVGLISNEIEANVAAVTMVTKLFTAASQFHDFFPQDFMHILYSDLHVGPA